VLKAAWQEVGGDVWWVAGGRRAGLAMSMERLPILVGGYLSLQNLTSYQISHVQKVDISTFLMLLRSFLSFRKFAYG
jgi:hypothetical protein